MADVQTYRRAQQRCVLWGTVSASVAFAGGALGWWPLIYIGAAGFLIALSTVIAIGVLAWRKFG